MVRDLFFTDLTIMIRYNWVYTGIVWGRRKKDKGVVEDAREAVAFAVIQARMVMSSDGSCLCSGLSSAAHLVEPILSDDTFVGSTLPHGPRFHCWTVHGSWWASSGVNTPFFFSNGLSPSRCSWETCAQVLEIFPQWFRRQVWDSRRFEEIMFRRNQTPHFHLDDAEQRQAKISELRAALGPLSAHGEKYCNEACLERYLEARNWNVDKSRKMLEESLKWRAAKKPQDIRWPDVSVEAETGKMYRASFPDREGKTVVVMRPTKQNTSSHEGQVNYLVYTLENAVLSLPEGQEKMVVLIDFTGWTLAHRSPIKTSRECMSVVQNHYPERLSVAFLLNAPKVFEASFKVIKVFLDQKTIQKFNFVYKENEESMKTLYKHIDPEVLPIDFGGKNNVVYNHEDYSKLMAEDDIKTANFWAEDGNHVMNGHSGPEVTPQSLLVAAKAS